MAPPEQPRAAGAARRRFPRRFGRYILERTLSRGGMGEVFLAIVRHLDQRCVIKTIRGDLTGEEEFVGRFADEAKILVRAGHPNIIRYFDAGKVASDYYIAMEYVHGRDLGDVLDRAYERGEPMPYDLGLYITANLLEGLHYAHELLDERGRRMGLVHRDVSPQNVLIGFDGSVKLIDFGLARTDLLPNRTQGALAVGKYGYMSPEQARHEPLDGRADIYSAGVMLFEVFTGDRLVDEQDQSTLWQRVLNPRHRSPRSVLPSLPPAIDDLVMKAVAVKPQDRFPTARAMAAEVERIRGPGSSREGLRAYLRRLYPRVDFEPPPLPAHDDASLVGGVEQSVIIATSREGAMSVFGRGELPIEGTMQMNVAHLREQIDRRRRELAAQRSSDPPAAPPPLSAGFGPIPSGTHPQVEPPTQVNRFAVTEDEEATTFMRPLAGESNTQNEAPGLLGATGLADPDRDDEQTVMMTAPPLEVQGFSPEDTLGSEATQVENTPTDDLDPTRRLHGEQSGQPPLTPSVVAVPARPTAMRDVAAEPNRAIRERVSAGRRKGAPDEVRFKAATLRDAPVARRAETANLPSLRRPRRPYLVAGLALTVLAAMIVVGLLVSG